MNKSSKQELVRYMQLKLLQAAKVITELRHQVEFKAIINSIETFKYTADFSYLENNKKIVEEFKGYIFERHDSILRVKILSALYPDLIFRITKPKGVYRVYKAGKCLREKIKNGKTRN